MDYDVSDIVSFRESKFEVVEDLIVKNKQKRKKLFQISAFSFLLLVGVFIFGFISISVFHIEFRSSLSIWTFLVLMGSFVLYIIAHEILHGVAFVLAGGVAWKDLSYGVVWKSGMAYCICKVPVSLRRSRISLLFPFLVICVPMIIYSIVAGDLNVLIAAAIFSSGSAGDFWYLWMLRKKDKRYYMLEEMPKAGYYSLGFYLFKKVS